MNILLIVLVILISLLWLPLAQIYCIFGEDVYFAIIDHFNLIHGNFRIGFITKRFNRTLSFFHGSRIGRMWYSFGLFVVFLTKIFYFMYFSFGIIQLISIYLIPFVLPTPQHPQRSIPMTIGVLVPGVHLPLNDFFPMVLSALIVMVIHEIGHTIASECEGVGIKSFSFSLYLLMPVAAVEMKEKKFRNVGSVGRLRILSAGIFHNVMFLLVLYFFFHFWSSGFVLENVKEVGYLEVKENRIPDIHSLIPEGSLVWEVNGKSVWGFDSIASLYQEEIIPAGICVDKALTFLNGMLGSQDRRKMGRRGRYTLDDCCSANRTNMDPRRLCFTSGSLECCIEVRKIFRNRRCDPDEIGRPDERTIGLGCRANEICVRPVQEDDEDYRVIGFLTTFPNETETNERLRAIFRYYNIQDRIRKEQRVGDHLQSQKKNILKHTTVRGKKKQQQQQDEDDRKKIKLRSDTLYYGRVGDFLHLLKLSEFSPKVPSLVYLFVKKMISFLWVMSVGFALLNLPPLWRMDGERIFDEIDNLLLASTSFHHYAWAVTLFQWIRMLSLYLVSVNISAVILIPIIFSRRS